MASSLPTPAERRRTLRQELSFAIRHEHAALNHLLATRLPLCLPPHTSTPFIYAQGLCVVRHLYTGFEYAWETLLSQTPSSPHYLHTLRTSHISRHLRLHEDVNDLTHLLGASHTKQLERLSNNTIHIHKDAFSRCLHSPHLVLAWSWTLYLALFNGGRYIRADLESAGSEFWGGGEKEEWPLRFWNFMGEEDGRDIEAEFVRRFDEAAEGLTGEESEEVVKEAKRIFGLVKDMVRELDGKVVGKDGALVESGVRNPVWLIGDALGWVSRGLWAAVGMCLGRRRSSGVHVGSDEKS